MARKPQLHRLKGSQKWVQDIINIVPDLLSSRICHYLEIPGDDPIHWLSPLKDDEYAEYSDQEVLDRLGVSLDGVPLDGFWPKGGPNWDALGRSESGKLLLVEAKAHVNEMKGAGLRAEGEARDKIEWALGQTRKFLGSRSKHDWTAGFYQYANRLAHLYLLRELNGLDAYLVFLYFTNDEMMNGPSSHDEWESAITMVKQLLGVRQAHKLSPFVADVFLDVREIPEK